MADLSIITLTREHPEYVERLSDCLDAQVGIDHLTVQRILVNNGPRKGLKTWDPSTRLAIARGWAVIEPGYNTSFSEGNNLGAKAATGDYLLLLNDDMVLEPEALSRLWSWRNETDLVGMLILNTDSTVNFAGTALWPSSHHILRNELREDVEEDRFYRCEAITFAAALMKRSLYEALGGLDERYIYGWEDTDFSCRVLDSGGSIGVCMNAVAIHDECGTRVRGDGGYFQNNSRLFHTTWPKDRIGALLDKYWDGKVRGTRVAV
jgi:GT2 family glycosyltransferase